jgi:hypothetical protein
VKKLKLIWKRIKKSLKVAFSEDKCNSDFSTKWLKGGTPDMRLSRQKSRQSDAIDWGCYLTLWSRCKHKYCFKRNANPLEWLDIWLDGKMVEINGKGKIRRKR